MAKADPTVAESSRTDANQQFTLIGVQGTLGTADIAGTARTMTFSGDPTSGAAYVYNLAPVVVGNATGGTLNTLGTVGSITNLGSFTNGGTIKEISNLAGGTVLNTGTNVNIVTGTINSLPQISVGTIPQVSVGTLPNVNIASGTQQTIGTVANLNNGSVNILTGTLQSSGTTTGVGVVSNLTNGSVNILTGTIQNSGAGTLTTGTLQNLVTGTLNALAAGTLTGGTLQNLASGTVTSVAEVVKGTTTLVTRVGNLGTLELGSVALNAGVNNVGDVDVATGTVTLVSTVTTLSNLTNGSVNILTGTIQSSGTSTGVGVVSNLTNGSVNLLTGTVTRVSNIGTLESGTVKVDPTPVPATLQFGTLGTAGGSFFGTLSAPSGAGTKHYISGLDIRMNAGTADIRILAGSAIQGTGVLTGGAILVGGYIAKNFTPVFVTGTNSELIYHFVGAGTAFITISYWKGV